MQLIIAACLVGIALSIPLPSFLQITLAFFWVMAFASATHDIAADGFYMLGLSPGNQSYFVGIRSTFYRIAMITGQGLIIILAGVMENATGPDPVDVAIAVEEGKTSRPVLAERLVDTPDTLAPLKVLVNHEQLSLGLNTLPTADAIATLAEVKQNNIDQGFYPEVRKAKQEKIEEAAEPGWWASNIKTPLEGKLRDWFGQSVLADETVTQEAGNLAILSVVLSRPPEDGKKLIVNIQRSEGSEVLSVVEGSRFEFNETNWNQPALTAIELNKNAKTATAATFTISSGNIELAWSVTFFVLAGIIGLGFLVPPFRST